MRKKKFVQIQCPLCYHYHYASITKSKDGRKTVSTYCPYTRTRIFHYTDKNEDFSEILQMRGGQIRDDRYMR